MDRLYALAFCIAALAACDSNKSTAEGPAEPVSKSRVNAVQATEKKAESPVDFCDVYKTAAEGPKFAYPELDGQTPPAAKGWKWVNVWATWCVPCIEEMPRLQAWESELAAKGLGDVVFISADNTAEILTKFAGKHPQLPGVSGPRIADVANLTPWVEGMGLQGAALPVHIFVDPEDNIRCLRSGGVSETDRPAVEKILES